LVGAIFFTGFTAPLAAGLVAVFAAGFVTTFAAGLLAFFTAGFSTFLAAGLATTFLAVGLATTFFATTLVAVLVPLAAGFAGALATFAVSLATGFLATGFAFGATAFAVAAFGVEDLMVFPLAGAVVALASDLDLVTTVFFDAVAEVLTGFKAMRTFSFCEVDRVEILGITKTHVKSAEMTGSCFDYATNFNVFEPTEPIRLIQMLKPAKAAKYSLSEGNSP
jgi:hypothetical protein